MVLDQECLQRLAENFYLEEGQKGEKNLLFNEYKIVESFKKRGFQINNSRKKDI